MLSDQCGNASGRTAKLEHGIGNRRLGIMLVLTAAVLWSTAGLFVRHLDMDLWTMLAWRSLFAALSLALVVWYFHRADSLRAVLAMGRPGLLAIPVAAVSMAGFVAALKLTTVANVMVIYATVPFITAGLAWVWMGERLARRVLLASAIALVGVAVMAGNETRPQDIAGNLMALLMTLAFGLQLVMARRYPRLDMAPINGIAALLIALLCLPVMAHAIPSPQQLLTLALFGFVTAAIGYLLFLIGGRHIPSGEAGLIGLVDVVLAPIWVWLAFAEEPATATLLGGGLVLAAAVFYLFGALRTQQHG